MEKAGGSATSIFRLLCYEWQVWAAFPFAFIAIPRSIADHGQAVEKQGETQDLGMVSAACERLACETGATRGQAFAGSLQAYGNS